MDPEIEEKKETKDLENEKQKLEKEKEKYQELMKQLNDMGIRIQVLEDKISKGEIIIRKRRKARSDRGKKRGSYKEGFSPDPTGEEIEPSEDLSEPIKEIIKHSGEIERDPESEKDPEPKEEKKSSLGFGFW